MLERKTVSQCPTADYCRGWNDAVDAMPKWISVEERLPDPQDYEGEPIEYIVHVEGAELATFALFDGERFIPSDFPGFIENRMFASPITHWMPLPEPPEEN